MRLTSLWRWSHDRIYRELKYPLIPAAIAVPPDKTSRDA
jgi:hypothetical protein